MNPTEPKHLQPPQVLPVTLSAFHLPEGFSGLHTQSGIEVSLPKSETGVQTPFKAIVSESTNRNLLLKSFYDSNVRGKAFDGAENVFSSLADSGISRCAFTTTFGIMKGEPLLNDQTAPQFRVDGLSCVPFVHQGHFFSPGFLVCDHIFCRQEYETQFVAVLSIDFLRAYFIRVQFSKQGWMIQLPPPPPTQISELRIYTDGCCLSNGVAAGDSESKPARGGYGIYFPNLPNGWDIYGALASSVGHTNQKAELTAVIRALQFVRLRKMPCENISIFTDSKYAVQGLNEWIPHLWRPNGYRTTTNRAVVNADLFTSLDEEVSLWTKSGIPVTLSHVPREQNKEADALAKLGATSSTPSITLSNPDKGTQMEAGAKAMGMPEKGGKIGAKAQVKNSLLVDGRPSMILGKGVIEEMMPLVQFTPDDDHWAEWQPVGGKREMLIV